MNTVESIEETEKGKDPLAELLEQLRELNSPRLWDAEDIGRYLGKSGRTVRRWKHKDGESSFKEFGLPDPLHNPFPRHDHSASGVAA